MADTLTQEQQEMVLIAKARRRRAAKDEAEGTGMKPREKVEDDAIGFVNKGIAQDFLGAPVDAVAAGMNLFEAERKRAASGIKNLLGISGETEEPAAPVEPFGGGQSVRRGFENVGIPTPDRAPQSPLEHAAQIGGGAAGLAIPLAKGAQVLSKAGGVTGKVAGSMNDLLVQNPLQSLAIEGGAVGGQGIARSVAEEQEYGQGGSMAAEVLGGLAGGFAASGPIQRLAMGTGRRIVKPYTAEASMDRAATRLREVTDDIPLAQRNIDKNMDTGLQPSAMTEDPGLMSMEQTIARYDPALGTKMDKQTSDAADRLAKAIGMDSKLGSMASTKKVLEANVKRTKAGLDTRIEIAAERSRNALDDIGEVATEAEISKIQRAELQSALDEATVQEKKLWAAVPKSAKVTTSNVIKEYKKLMRELPDVQKDNMPAKARQQLGGDMESEMIPAGVIDPRTNEMIMLEGPTPAGKLGNLTTVNDLDGLYKVLGEVAKDATTNNKNNTARIAGKLREAIIEDMKNIKGDKAARESVGKAREFSKLKNEKFSEGTIGKILGTKKGAIGVDPELTLGAGVGQGGLKGSLAAREIAKATDKDIGQLGAVQEFIKRKFLAHSLVDGIIDPNKARDYIAKNPDLMETYPHLREQFKSARNAEDVSRSIKKSSEALRGKIDQKTVSKTAAILNAPVHKEVANIFSSQDPAASMQNVVNAVKRDRSGAATKGLRAGVADYLTNLIKTADVDVKNRPISSGAKLKTALAKGSSSRSAMEKVYSAKEMSNWDRIADTLILNNRQMAKKGTPAAFVIQDKSGVISELIGKVSGTKFASWLSAKTGGGGSIQVPAMGAAMGKKAMKAIGADKAQQVLIDALTTDPQLLKALYLRKSKANDKLFDLQWRKYLARSGTRLTAQEAADELTDQQ